MQIVKISKGLNLYDSENPFSGQNKVNNNNNSNNNNNNNNDNQYLIQ